MDTSSDELREEMSPGAEVMNGPAAIDAAETERAAAVARIAARRRGFW